MRVQQSDSSGPLCRAGGRTCGHGEQGCLIGPDRLALSGLRASAPHRQLSARAAIVFVGACAGPADGRTCWYGEQGRLIGRVGLHPRVCMLPRPTMRSPTSVLFSFLCVIAVVGCKEKPKVYLGAKAAGHAHAMHTRDVDAFVAGQKVPHVEKTAEPCDASTYPDAKCDGEKAILICHPGAKAWFRVTCTPHSSSEPVAFYGCAWVPSRGEGTQCQPVLGKASDYEFIR